jgi:integrase
MSIRAINGWLYYRFQYRGARPEVSTGLVDTPQNRKLAAVMEAKHKRDLIQGRFGLKPPEPIGFSEAFDAFIQALKIDRAGKPNTWRRTQTSGASLKAFFEQKTVYLLTDGSAENYKRWRLSGVKDANGEWQIKPVKPITVRHDMDNLSLFFQWAKKQNYAPTNPVDDAEKPTIAAGEDERMYILSVEEERRYFSHLKQRKISENGNLHDLGRLMIQQGVRPDEAMSIAKADVDLDARKLTIPKSKSNAGRRTLKLTTESWQILARRMLSPGPWIFPSSRRKGEHITKLNCPHDRAVAKLQMSFVMYDLRHTFATRQVEAGTDLPTLKGIMGHKDIRVTQKYVHPSQDHQDKAMQTFEQKRRAIEREFEEQLRDRTA